MRQKIKILRSLSILTCAFFLLVGGPKAAMGAEEKFPTRPVELILPTGAGGGADMMARIVADAIEPFLGQKVVVINKPGGSGTIGINTLLRADPDGYTLGCVWNAPMTMAPHVLKAGYTVNDFIYITQVAKTAGLFCVRPEFPVKTAQEFFEYARKNPGKLTYANDGVGAFVMFSGERIFQALKVKLRPVPYADAGESMKALLGGHVDVYGGVLSPALPHIQAGTVRPIFVTSVERLKELPEVPGVSDLGHPEIETVLWRGIIGPKGIPADRLAILENAFRQASQTDKVKDNLAKRGETVVASSGKQFEELVRSEAAAMAIVAKEVGLTPK